MRFDFIRQYYTLQTNAESLNKQRVQHYTADKCTFIVLTISIFDQTNNTKVVYSPLIKLLYVGLTRGFGPFYVNSGVLSP